MPYAIAAGGVEDFFGAAIANACRFNDDDSAYLTRTPGGAGTDLKKFTFSSWVKRGELAAAATLLSAGATGDETTIQFNSADQLQFFQIVSSSTVSNILTDMLFRDPAAHYHIVIGYDSTAGASADRIAIEINGVAVTFTESDAIDSNREVDFNTTDTQDVGRRITPGEYMDGYLAETILVDGQKLSASSFGKINGITGQWVPKAYTGSFGTNGFHLDFADSGDLGNDVSGNANDYTSSGLATNDQVPDTPTDNYSTLNAIQHQGAAAALGIYSNGNLEWDYAGGANFAQAFGSQRINTGKYYFEVTLDEIGFPTLGIGVSTALAFETLTGGGGDCPGSYGYSDASGANLTEFGTTPGAGQGTARSGTGDWANADVICVAFDADAGEVWMRTNGGSWYTGNPETPTSPETNWNTPASVVPWIYTYGSPAAGMTVNFGQHTFAQTPPSDFKPLSAANLPDPVIINPSKNFNTKLYTGNGSAGNAQTGVSFQPDLVWIKSRDEGSTSYTGDHKLWDTVRGTTKSLESNTADQEATESTGLTAFGTDGFTVGALDQVNFSGDAFVAWCWKEGALPGFDIVSYSGDNTANRNISHSLGVAPAFALVKRLDASEDWFAHHKGLTGDDYFLKLNGTGAQSNTASPFGTGNWSATQFMVDNDATNNANASGSNNYIAYLFASVPGFAEFGSYEGNNSANGPFVWCGFRPALVIAKNIDAAASFAMFDHARSRRNVHTGTLFADTNAAENSDADVDFLANGFKLRRASTGFNPSSQTIIFAAFAEAPFKYARAR